VARRVCAAVDDRRLGGRTRLVITIMIVDIIVISIFVAHLYFALGIFT